MCDDNGAAHATADPAVEVPETALPVALLREIFCYAHAPALVPTNTEADSAFAKRATQPSTAGLRSLALVCTTWQHVVAELLAHFAQHELTLQFTVGNEEAEQLVHEAYLRMHGHAVRDLRVRLVSPKQPLWWDAAARAATDASLQSQWIDWPALLQHVPNVERLDLSLVPLHHFTLSDVISAGGTHCPNIQALILPRRDASHSDAVDASIDATLCALYGALQAWYLSFTSDKAQGGLRQLTMPSCSLFDLEATSTRYLNAIASYCPALEYLDGWKATYSETRFVRSDRSWSVAPATWRAFCSASTQLREFSWVVVPFADAFFQPFGAVCKPLLTHLQLTYNVAAPFRIIRAAYSTRGLCALLRGVPALAVLDVVLHRIQSAHALVYPHLDEMIDGAAFDDAFIQQLAHCCRRLERLHIRAVGTRYPRLSTITDLGLHALATLPRLRCVELLGATCSARALLALLLDSAANVPTRSVTVHELGSQFGDVATELLALIASGDSVDPSVDTDTDDERPAVLHAQLQQRARGTSLLLTIASRRGFVFQRRMLDAASAALQRFCSSSSGGTKRVRLVAVVADKAANRESDALARLAPRAIGATLAASRDVVRVGQLVVFSDASLLSEQLRAAVGRHSSACVVQL